MKSLPISTLSKSIAALAVVAGLVTGGLLSAQPMQKQAPHASATSIIDPTIATVTIVARRLTRAEKARMPQVAGALAAGGMTEVSGTARPLQLAGISF